MMVITEILIRLARREILVRLVRLVVCRLGWVLLRGLGGNLGFIFRGFLDMNPGHGVSKPLCIFTTPRKFKKT